MTALQSETNLDSSCGWCVWATDETDPAGQFREWVLGGDSEPAWEIVLGAAPDEDQQQELRRLLDDACVLNARTVAVTFKRGPDAVDGPLSWTEPGGVVQAWSPGGWVSLETAVRLAEAAGHEVVWMRRRRPSS